MVCLNHVIYDLAFRTAVYNTICHITHVPPPPPHSIYLSEESGLQNICGASFLEDRHVFIYPFQYKKQDNRTGTQDDQMAHPYHTTDYGRRNITCPLCSCHINGNMVLAASSAEGHSRLIPFQGMLDFPIPVQCFQQFNCRGQLLYAED